jgi:excinuclease ABC subunit C
LSLTAVFRYKEGVSDSFSASLAPTLELLPDSPGVYLFKNRRGVTIYIGKAKSLRSRVRSYFQSSRHPDPKVVFLQQTVADLEYIVTDTEVEALILESSLVKKHQPRLNVRLKDDKSFLHIKLTVNEHYPRVLLTRRIRSDGALYFGPYLPASLARNTIKIINRHFQLRTCSIPIDGSLERPCLEYFIHRCLGPCVDGLTSKEEYAKAVRDVILLLEGRNEELLRRLTEKMQAASREELFETAAFYRDRIKMVRDLAEKQKMAKAGDVDVDVFGYFREGRRLALQLFSMRSGRVVGKREFFWEEIEFFEPRIFLRDALQQYYHSAGFVPAGVYLPTPIEDQDLIAEWLNGQRNGRRKVRITVPRKGDKLDLVMLVERNAQIAFESRFRITKPAKEQVLRKLRDALELSGFPRRIEAFDVSNIQGAESVGSLVVCESGVMAHRDYRKFRIKTVAGTDDFASIHEIVLRRYRRLLREREPLPDLILIDGGKGQLHAAYQALAKLGIEDVPLIALAKREELVFVQGQDDPLDLDASSATLRLLQEIRDEAHRFAVSYHRRRRSIRDFSSELDSIPGIGAKRKRRLLQHFGSVAGVRRASPGELTPFLGEKLAQTVKRHLEGSATTESTDGD